MTMDSQTDIQIVTNHTIDLKTDGNNKEFDEKSNFIKDIFGPSLNLKAHLKIQDKIKHILESNVFHIIIIVLVLIDTLCVAGELVIAAENKEIREKLEVVEEVLKYLGLSILSFFMVELIFKIIFARHELYKSKLEMFDALVVVVSFTLDLIFLNNNNGADIAIGFLTLLRLWRLTRIVNGNI